MVGPSRHRERTPSLRCRRSLDICPALGTVERVEDREVAKRLRHDVVLSEAGFSYRLLFLTLSITEPGDILNQFKSNKKALKNRAFLLLGFVEAFEFCLERQETVLESIKFGSCGAF